MEKSKKGDGRGGGESEEDPFCRLPEELLILIFTKLSESNFKFLGQCSLVSKRFASTIPLIPTVSITLPYPTFIHESMDESISEYHSYKSTQIWTVLDSLRKFQENTQIWTLVDSLRKFQEIRSVHVKFALDGDDSSSVLLNWKAKLGTELETIVCLSYTSTSILKEARENEDDGEDDPHPAISMYQMTSQLYSGFQCIIYVLACYYVLLLLIEHHPTVRRVLITDSKKQGKICMREKQLVELKSNWANAITSLKGSFIGTKIPGTWKLGSELELRLPLSGYVLNGVILFVCRMGVGQKRDDDDIIRWDFEEEEDKVFREAVTSILMNHEDKMQLLT